MAVWRERAPQLRALFRDAGYTAHGVGELLGTSGMRALAAGDRALALHGVDPGDPLGALVHVFLADRPAPAAALSALDRVAPGLLRPTAQGVRAAIDLRPYGEDWYVASDHPPAGPGSVIGVGAASLTLAAALVPGRYATALDVGTGSGVLALHLAERGARVTASDTNPRALALAGLTAALSGIELETVLGDRFEPVSGRRFDLVAVNPPFVIGPTRLSYRDSGMPGDTMCRSLVEAAAGVLAPGGIAQLLVSWIQREGAPWPNPLVSWVPPDCDALLVQREVLTPTEHVALWLHDGGAERDAEIDGALGASWLDDLAEGGASGIGYGVVILRSTTAPPVVSPVELRHGSSLSGTAIAGWLARCELLREGVDLGGLSLVAADGVALHTDAMLGPEGWQTVELRLSAPESLPDAVRIDPVIASLVEASDGHLPAATLLGLLAGAFGVGTADADVVRAGDGGGPDVVRGPDVAARGLAALRALLEAGLLVPEPGDG